MAVRRRLSFLQAWRPFWSATGSRRLTRVRTALVVSLVALATFPLGLPPLPSPMALANARIRYAGPPGPGPIRNRLPVLPKTHLVGSRKVKPPKIFTGHSDLERFIQSENATPGGGSTGALNSDNPTEDFTLDTSDASVYKVEGADHLLDITTAPTNYQDPFGYWHNMNTSLVHDDGAGVWQNAADSVSLQLPDVLADGSRAMITM